MALLSRRPTDADTERSRTRLASLSVPTRERGWVPADPPVHGLAPTLLAGQDEAVVPSAELGGDGPAYEDAAEQDRAPVPEDVVPGRHRPAPPRERRIDVAWARLVGLVPAHWRSARLDPRWTGVRAVLVVAVAAVAVTALVLWHQRPTSRPLGGAPVAPVGLSASSAPSPRSSTGSVVVDVSGAVHRPGLVHLAAGSRVADAIAAAGGADAGTNLSALNLARKVVDGEQIAVGVAAAAPAGGAVAGGSSSTGGSATAGSSVDLNTATLADLDTLPGVGPVLAQRILDYRTAHSGFRSVDQLREVTGIGDAKFADIKPLVTV